MVERQSAPQEDENCTAETDKPPNGFVHLDCYVAEHEAQSSSTNDAAHLIESLASPHVSPNSWRERRLTLWSTALLRIKRTIRWRQKDARNEGKG